MSKKIFKLFWVFAALTILMAALGPASAPAGLASARIHPVLLELAQKSPSLPVSVIVQATQDIAGLRAEAVALGVEVTNDLTMIKAFAAKMPAGTALKMAGLPGVKYVSPDAMMVEAGKTTTGSTTTTPTTTSTTIKNNYILATQADQLWKEAINGTGVTVAVIDSGINDHTDLKARILAKVETNTITNYVADPYGHGSHIAGIIGGSGAASSGAHVGMAPKSNLISVRISDDYGMASTSDVVAGLQWIYDNYAKYQIRVVNLSLNSTIAESYHTSPLDAAVEILWFNGIVVVVSAGNNGDANIYPPANDPFVITVGAVDDKGTAAITDDAPASFSAAGLTVDGFLKPEIVAPGTNVISLNASNGSVLAKNYSTHVVKDYCAPTVCYYFRMSGTSTSAPVVTGAVALLLQDEPGLNPDQVKFRLMSTARPIGFKDFGYLDAYAAVKGTSTLTANTGIAASQLLFSGLDPATWNSVNWGSVNWGSVNWGSVNWGSVNWGSVNWGSDYWGP